MGAARDACSRGSRHDLGVKCAANAHDDDAYAGNGYWLVGSDHGGGPLRTIII